MTIVNQSDRKCNSKLYENTETISLSPNRWVRNLRFPTGAKWIRGDEGQMSIINLTNHTSAINSWVPPKFNHPYNDDFINWKIWWKGL